jgi:hypothetical protein
LAGTSAPSDNVEEADDELPGAEEWPDLIG